MKKFNMDQDQIQDSLQLLKNDLIDNALEFVKKKSR